MFAEQVPPLIATLEPIAGAGLAVSLAYLALERFRYRSSIEGVAAPILTKLDKADLKDTEFEHLNDLRWLCRQHCNGHTPRGFGANFYRVIFRNQLDEITVAAFGLSAGFALSAGVALNLDRWSGFGWLNSAFWTGFFFYICVGAIGLPAALVLCGRRNVKWGHGFARHCEVEILRIMKQSAMTAVVPPQPAPQPQNDVAQIARTQAAQASREAYIKAHGRRIGAVRAVPPTGRKP